MHSKSRFSHCQKRSKHFFTISFFFSFSVLNTSIIFLQVQTKKNMEYPHQGKEHVFVGNLDRNVTLRDIEDLFIDYRGQYTNINLKMNYAFLYFKDRRDADDCLRRIGVGLVVVLQNVNFNDASQY